MGNNNIDDATSKYNRGDYILSHNEEGYSIGIITNITKSWRVSDGYICNYIIRGCYIDKYQYNSYNIKIYTPVKNICVREEDVLCLVPKEAIESLYDVTIHEKELI